MAEVNMGKKISELATVLARRIRKDDNELVLEMGSYLSNLSRSLIDRLYKNLIVGRREGER